MGNYILAVTGASGSIYALRLLEVFLEKRITTHLVISKPAQVVARQELGLSWAELLENKYQSFFKRELLKVWDVDDFSAPVASGSYPSQGMVIVPTSMSTLAAIAQGFSTNLIQRGADIMLKEKKPLVLVPRETPLNSIHLKNMLTLCEAGAHIVPPVPAFYNHPQTIEQMIDFVVGRILDVLKIENQLYQRWGEESGQLIRIGGMLNV